MMAPHQQHANHVPAVASSQKLSTTTTTLDPGAPEEQSRWLLSSDDNVFDPRTRSNFSPAVAKKLQPATGPAPMGGSSTLYLPSAVVASSVAEPFAEPATGTP